MTDQEEECLRQLTGKAVQFAGSRKSVLLLRAVKTNPIPHMNNTNVLCEYLTWDGRILRGWFQRRRFHVRTRESKAACWKTRGV